MKNPRTTTNHDSWSLRPGLNGSEKVLNHVASPNTCSRIDQGLKCEKNPVLTVMDYIVVYVASRKSVAISGKTKTTFLVV